MGSSSSGAEAAAASPPGQTRGWLRDFLSLCPVCDWGWAQEAEESSQTWVALGVVPRVGLIAARWPHTHPILCLQPWWAE